MNRLKRFKNAMNDKGLDSALITDKANIRYLSGFTGTSGYLLISAYEQLLLTDFRYIEQATMQSPEFEIKNTADFKVSEYAKKFNSTGFEDESISFKAHLKFNEMFKNLLGMGMLLLDLRSIKGLDELENIKKAAQIADDGFSHIVEFIKEGMSELKIARELEFYMLDHGAEKLSFETIVASGARGSLPHGFPTDKKVKRGDLIVMDFGCVVNGYCSDMTRTVGIGEISGDLKDVYYTVLSAQEETLKIIKAGVKCDEMHFTAMNIINKNYNGLCGHALGHGVGLNIHEEPTFSPRSDYLLPEGAVITVEPGIYIPNKCGVRIEDLVYITKSGILNMTNSTKELIVI